jgi:flap endonuclease-1
MGVNLGKIIPRRQVDLKSLCGKKIAIDAYNALYQFIAIIRQPDGTPLKDHTGKITSHLSGLFYRTCSLIEMGIKAVYVFDGVPPSLKETEIKRRLKIKKEAQKKYEKALIEGKTEDARIYAQMTSRLKDYMLEDSIHLLKCLGIPWIMAPSEGEAQATYITKIGDTDYCASQDYDSLLFGAPFLLRNLTLSGRRKIPRKNIYVEVVPEIIEMKKVLKELEITHEQLIDIAVLVGTDFNPNGVKGIGPKTALRLIKKHRNLENVLPTIKDTKFSIDPEKIRSIFLRPKITDNYKIIWDNPDIECVVDFLCEMKDFSEERVRRTLTKAIEGNKKAKAKTTLDVWF